MKSLSCKCGIRLGCPEALPETFLSDPGQSEGVIYSEVTRGYLLCQTLAYVGNTSKYCFFFLTPECIVECHGDHTRVEASHGLNSQLGDTLGVEESVPTFLHLLQSEPAGEVDTQVYSN